MLYQFEFRPYRRQFKRALSTSHGNWDIREGIILRFTDDKGAIGWGEIAPIPWFGSETLPSAINFCRQLGDEITTETIFSIPSKLPSCQFGFESALNFGFWILDFGLKADFPNSVESATNPQSKIQNLKSKIAYSCLLPAGEAALHQWQTLWQQGYRTFKWKINVVPIQDEIKIFAKLIQALPTSAKLRLDANAGLNWSAANEWLKVCENYSQIEFLEQPLPVEQFDAMLDLANRYSTPIALDESVATLSQLQTCYEKGWRSIFVIKPGIVGSPRLLRQFCQQHDIDVVFSSVFETAIGRQAALNLAAELSHRDRAVGFGVNHWFNEDEETWLENLWNNPH